jgi:hypothetical protein
MSIIISTDQNLICLNNKFYKKALARGGCKGCKISCSCQHVPCTPDERIDKQKVIFVKCSQHAHTYYKLKGILTILIKRIYAKIKKR